MSIEVKVPTLGESVSEATVGQWLKKPGEAVALDEPIVSLETDKVAVEVPAPAAGVLGAHIVLATRGVAVPWTFALATFILTVTAAVFAAFTPGVVAAYRDPVTVMRTHM